MTARPILTPTVLAIAKGEARMPDPLDDLQTERLSALHVASSIWCPAELRDRLRSYASDCEYLLAEVQSAQAIAPPADGPMPTFEEVRELYEKFAVDTAAQVIKAAENIRNAPTLPAPAEESCLACGSSNGYHAERCPTFGNFAATNKPDRHVQVTEVFRRDGDAPPALVALNVSVNGEPVKATGPGWDAITPWKEAPPPTQRSGERRKHPRALLVDRLGFERIGDSHQGAREIRYSSVCGLGRPPIVVRFELYGNTERDGERLLEYHEVDERPMFPLVKPEPPLTAERLARCLWRGDADVMAFVDRVAERPSSWDERWEARRLAAEERAWQRDELGARTRWLAIAEAAVERLRGGK